MDSKSKVIGSISLLFYVLPDQLCAYAYYTEEAQAVQETGIKAKQSKHQTGNDQTKTERRRLIPPPFRFAGLYFSLSDEELKRGGLESSFNRGSMPSTAFKAFGILPDSGFHFNLSRRQPGKRGNQAASAENDNPPVDCRIK